MISMKLQRYARNPVLEPRKKSGKLGRSFNYGATVGADGPIYLLDPWGVRVLEIGR